MDRDRVPIPDDSDPDVARVRAVVESRLLGDVEATSRIGRFAVLERIAEGGMGIVFAAFDTELDRKVAIKLLRADRDDATLRQRIVREAQAMAKLSHPNVAHVYEVGEHGGRTFIAMELVQGRTLRDWLAERPRAWPEVLELYVQAGRGLAAAHAAGVIHRDFKPDNAIVGEDDRVRVLDFGLARTEAIDAIEDGAPPRSVADTTSPSITRTGVLLGTPAYMAPEQLARKEVDAKSDQFAYCVALWEALHGQRPFVGTSHADLVESVAHGRIADPPRPVRAPQWLRAVLTRGLSVDRSKRWPDMNALLQALARGRRKARRRRVGIALVGLALAAAGAEAWRRDAEATRVAACEREGARLHEIWNDDARTRVHTAIVATGAAFAQRTAELVTPWIDEHTRAWAEARTQVCRDGTVHDRLDADTLDRARWCLDEVAFEVERLVVRLEGADRPAVIDAVRSASELPPVHACVDPERLRMLPAPAVEDREAIIAIRDELARASDLAHAGRHDDALAALGDTVQEAAAIDWPPLEVRARLVLASVLERREDFAEAESAFVEAYFRAAIAGATESALDAAQRLAFLVGERRGRPAEGLHWARLAEIEDQRMGQRDALLTSKRLMSLGSVQSAAGRLGEARETYERALALRDGVLGPNDPSSFRWLLNVAEVNRRLGDHANARALFERALGLAEAAFGPRHPEVAVALHHLASLYNSTGDSRTAIELGERAFAIRTAALGPDDLTVAHSLVALAAAHSALGDYEIAITQQERALAIQERLLGPDNRGVASSLSNLGDLSRMRGSNAAAEEYYRKALAIWENAGGPDHPDVAEGLTRIALLRAVAGDHETAIAMQLRVLAIQEKNLGPNHHEVGVTLIAIADAHARNGEHDEARRYYERALANLEATLGSQHRVICVALGGLAQAHFDLKEPAKARTVLERALELEARGMQTRPGERARIHCGMARAHWETDGDGERAVAFAREGIELLREAGPAYKSTIRDCERWLTDPR